MKILFDQGTPVPLRRYLNSHRVDTAFERGWQTLENGQLLGAAKKDQYTILITTDQNLRYQQNFQNRKIAIIVLLSTSWPRIQKHVETIIKIVEETGTGEYREIPIEI